MKPRPPLPVVQGDQSVGVCVSNNDVISPGVSERPRETVVRNEAVRVTDPASRVSSEALNTTPGSSNDSNNSKSSADTTGARVTQRKQLKLEKYDGMSTPPIETFLAKYSNCVKYNRWSDEERGVFLRDSLTGNASQVLWETSSDASADDIIRLLKNRYGNSNQMERSRAELHSIDVV